jgi:hypothetical protein
MEAIMAPTTPSKAAKGSSSATHPRYSKWIESPDEHAERKGQSLATQSHEVIQKWAEERRAKPVTLESQRDEPRVLRFDFPGYGGQNLAQISWDDWFKTFDNRNVVFIYQERLRNGNQSNFFKLDQAEGKQGRATAKRGSR